MNRFPFIRAAIVFILVATLMLAAQSVYPTGTTIYDPDKTWNGYTVLSPLRTEAVIVIDMNGNVVKLQHQQRATTGEREYAHH